jgi:hypothetical protein
MGYQPCAGTPEIDSRWDAMFHLLRNKRWVLSPWALDLPEGITGNIFKNPRGQYLVSLVSQKASRHDEKSKPVTDISVVVRLPDGKNIHRAYGLCPRQNGEIDVSWNYTKEGIHITLPKHHVATLLVLEPKELNSVSSFETHGHD